MLRRSSVLLWLALYTALSLCSPALHELAGGHQGRTPVAGGTGTDPGLHGDPTTHVASTDVADTGDDGHCPVCSYLAHAQAAPVAASTATCERVAIATDPDAIVEPKPGSPLPSRPRAPPHADLAHA